MRTPGDSTRALPLAVLVLLLGVLAGTKLAFDPVAVGLNRPDGTFYYLVAESVAAGDGLAVDVSLYAKGLHPLPAPTSVQPLWPLVLGLGGRVLGLERAATWIPEALFTVSLLLLYLLANRVGRALGSEVLVRVRGRPVLDLGVAAVALFGTNAVFYAYTSRPLTEALAFTLLFATLLAVPARPGPGATARALLAGVLAGAAYLTRSQLVGVAPALCTLLALAAFPLRDRGYLRLAGCSALGSLAAIAPWVVFLWTGLRQRPPLRALVDFTAYRETPALPAFRGFVESEGALARIVDVGRGLLHAFTPGARQTYLESFGPVAWAVPLAALLALWGLRTLETRSPDALARRLPALLCAGAGAAAVFPVHLAHTAFPYEWLFHWRHGLPLILLIVPAAALLWARGGLWRWALAAAFAWSLLLPTHGPARFTPGSVAGMRTPEARLAAWLDAHPEPPLVLSTRARTIALWSRAAGHGARCESPPTTTRAYFELLPIDYLILFPRDEGCPMLRGLEEELEPVRRFGAPPGAIRVLRWKGSR